MNSSVVPRAVVTQGGAGAVGDARKVCTMCGAEFPSRSKLMKHLNEEGVHGSGAVPMRTDVDFNAAFLNKGGFKRGRPLAGIVQGSIGLLSTTHYV